MVCGIGAASPIRGMTWTGEAATRSLGVRMTCSARGLEGVWCWMGGTTPIGEGGQQYIVCV